MSFFKHKHYWTAIRALWPFDGPWGTWCEGCNTVLDQGMTKEQAEAAAEKENRP